VAGLAMALTEKTEEIKKLTKEVEKVRTDRNYLRSQVDDLDRRLARSQAAFVDLTSTKVDETPNLLQYGAHGDAFEPRRPALHPRSLRHLQTTLPWTIKYSTDFRANPQSHKDFAHALLHVQKAAGKLAAMVDDIDHNRDVALDHTIRENARFIADLVVCALRLANTFPGGSVDLENATIARITTKNYPSTP
jgi:hypothetical protein